ncbi:unnamed protein product [Cuscuta europaea]|uniref:Uncharacterized protein n=1 Tax=Cuscuta europaea TaxID=41803 RepID=A0A9P0ZIC1_CUSEU|nr:unnamed protein product [Cuscuta europaea]
MPQKKMHSRFLGRSDYQEKSTAICCNEPYRYVKAKEFAEAYQSFHVGRKMAHGISVQSNITKSHSAALSNDKFGIGKKQLLKVCKEREYMLMHRNSFAYIFKIIQAVQTVLVKAFGEPDGSSLFQIYCSNG